MKVKDIMTSQVRTCSSETNLATAAALMLDGDCGLLPVVDNGRVDGVVTDRDLFIALATRNRLASDLKVGDVVQRPVHTCGPDDDVAAVLATMKQHQVRRVVVEGFGGTVMGVVSINDLVLAAAASKAVKDHDIADVLRAIGTQHRPTPHIQAA